MSRHKIKRIDGHNNFYRNETSGIIYYKDERFKFSTKCRTLREAKKFAEIEIEKRRKNISAAAATRNVRKIDNPPIGEVYYEMLEEKRIEISETTLTTWRKSYVHGFGLFFGGHIGPRPPEQVFRYGLWLDNSEKIPKLKQYVPAERESDDPTKRVAWEWARRGETMLKTERGILRKAWHVSDINDENLLKFKKWYLEERGTRHAQKLIVHLFFFFRWLHKNKILREMPDLDILKNLPELVEKKAKREPVGRNLTLDEDKRLIAAAKAHSTEAWLMVTLGIRCGFRKESEALSLEWPRINFKKNMIQVWSMKNHDWRNMPISDEVAETFAAHREFLQTKYGKLPLHVFPWSRLSSEPMYGQLFDKIWVEVKRAAGIRGRLRFHDLRHTFATRTAEYGIPPVIACEMLDMSLKIYQETYCHPSEESVSEMVNKMHEKRLKMGGSDQ